LAAVVAEQVVVLHQQQMALALVMDVTVAQAADLEMLRLV
jgi:hypothetical protein